MRVDEAGHTTTDILARSGQLKQVGWLYTPSCFKSITNIAERMNEVASLFGTPVRSRRQNSLTERLKPTAVEHARPRSLSAIYGFNQFPLHTDTAHWASPCRYICFTCTAPGAEPCATLLHTFDGLAFDSAERRLIKEAVFLVRNGRQSFYSSILSSHQLFVRFDPGCMEPTTHSAETALGLVQMKLANSIPMKIMWGAGDLLIVDNWRTLHGRESLVSSHSNRELMRILTA